MSSAKPKDGKKLSPLGMLESKTRSMAKRLVATRETATEFETAPQSDYQPQFPDRDDRRVSISSDASSLNGPLLDKMGIDLAELQRIHANHVLKEGITRVRPPVAQQSLPNSGGSASGSSVGSSGGSASEFRVIRGQRLPQPHHSYTGPVASVAVPRISANSSTAPQSTPQLLYAHKDVTPRLTAVLHSYGISADSTPSGQASEAQLHRTPTLQSFHPRFSISDAEEHAEIESTIDNSGTPQSEEIGKESEMTSETGSETFSETTNGSSQPLRTSGNSRNTRGTRGKPKLPLIAEETPPERVARAIELHAEGNLRESTYLLSLAAQQGDQTAMLLYGVALRNGWGVRADEAEAFRWLKTAAHVVDVKALAGVQEEIDPFELEKRLQREKTVAQRSSPLAIALYELGMSYVNSWGTEKNETLGVTCIELAAVMGDVEAMTQAGTIWSTKGSKRKKDMRRAGAWFRLAELHGVKLVGNSWIYKEKYR